MSNKYYVYILRDPRNGDQPFYVGKGSGYRVKRHLNVSSKASKENPWKCAKIQKIREAGPEPQIEYHATNLSEEDAYALEAHLIAKFGRAKIDEGGILTNQCVDARHHHGQLVRPCLKKLDRRLVPRKQAKKIIFTENSILLNGSDVRESLL